ncbi:MAG: TIGR04133 family radical SAM/SPASM protein [Bacteroidales bacterium]|nr:TIGR04133 family radical SAM/SPASM protein [Bacteroidales bacterium]
MGTPVRDFLHRRFRDMEVRTHELNYLFWECTTRCNLHCRHCGSDCAAASGDKDMPLDDFLRAFDTIPPEERKPGFTVVVTGGEPLLRPDLCQLGVALKKRHVGWGIVSNGWLYDRDMHRRLLEAGIDTLTISLDGLEAEHDWMRGRQGSYSHALNAIAIAAHDRRINFDVVTCVNQRNLPQLQSIHDLLASLGVPQWRIFTIIPIGRALGCPELHLTDSQFVQLMEFIKDKREHKVSPMNVTFSCEGYLGRYERHVRQNPYFCHAGINIASVLIDGTICGCPNIDRNAFAQGNIYRDNLWEVWQNGFRPFRDRSWAKKGICKDCKAFRNCLGNGMHNWHGDCTEVINCHYRKTLGTG